MGVTSALFSDVWVTLDNRASEPKMETQPRSPVAPVREDVDYRARIEDLNREMMQRSQMCIIFMSIGFAIMFQRIHRLERRLLLTESLRH